MNLIDSCETGTLTLRSFVRHNISAAKDRLVRYHRWERLHHSEKLVKLVDMHVTVSSYGFIRRKAECVWRDI